MSAAKFIGIGVAAIAAYELYLNFVATPSGVVTAPAGTTTSIAPIPVPATITPPPSEPNWVTLENMAPGDLIRLAQGNTNTLLNVSQWNYYATILTGIPGQALGDDGSPMNVHQYLNLIGNVARGKGLGMILNTTDIYSGSAQASGFGDMEFIRALSGLGRLAGIVDAPELNSVYVDESPIVLAASRNGSLDSTTRGFYLGDGFNG